MIADELRRQADFFTDLAELQSRIGRTLPSALPRASAALRRPRSRHRPSGLRRPRHPATLQMYGELHRSARPPQSLQKLESNQGQGAFSMTVFSVHHTTTPARVSPNLNSAFGSAPTISGSWRGDKEGRAASVRSSASRSHRTRVCEHPRRFP
jgi:hypothetical protein